MRLLVALLTLCAPLGARADGEAPVWFESKGRPQQVFLRLPDGRRPFVCETPCVASLPIGLVTLDTAGDGVRRGTFDLGVPPEGARVKLRSASSARFGAGAGLTAAGGALFVAGVIAGAIGLDAFVNAADGNGFWGTLFTAAVGYSVAVAGGVAAAAGVVIGVPGIVLLQTSRPGADRVERGPAVSLGPGQLRVTF